MPGSTAARDGCRYNTAVKRFQSCRITRYVLRMPTMRTAAKKTSLGRAEWLFPVINQFRWEDAASMP